MATAHRKAEKAARNRVCTPRIEGKYYRGRIAKYNPKTGYGFVESMDGSHIFFYADQIRLEGPHRRKADIAPGKVVGFDVGWTNRGIRISKMKIFSNEESRRGLS